MSALSLREVLANGIVDVTAINLARIDYKQTGNLSGEETAQNMLGGMLDHCQKLHLVLQRSDITSQIGTDDQLQREYTVVTRSIGLQVGKLQKLIRTLPMSSASSSLSQRAASSLSQRHMVAIPVATYNVLYPQYPATSKKFNEGKAQTGALGYYCYTDNTCPSVRGDTMKPKDRTPVVQRISGRDRTYWRGAPNSPARQEQVLANIRDLAKTHSIVCLQEVTGETFKAIQRSVASTHKAFLAFYPGNNHGVALLVQKDLQTRKPLEIQFSGANQRYALAVDVVDPTTKKVITFVSAHFFGHAHHAAEVKTVLDKLGHKETVVIGADFNEWAQRNPFNGYYVDGTGGPGYYLPSRLSAPTGIIVPEAKPRSFQPIDGIFVRGEARAMGAPPSVPFPTASDHAAHSALIHIAVPEMRDARGIEASNEFEQSPSQVLQSAVRGLRAGKQKEALAQIGALQETAPDVVGKILGKIYELAGKPTRATNPAIAHDRFGSIAFFDYKGNTPQGKAIDIPKRIAAIEAVLGELTETLPSSSSGRAAAASAPYRGGDDDEVGQEIHISRISQEDGYIVFGHNVNPLTTCFRAFQPVSFKFGGQKFKCVEAAYQAGRDLSRIAEFASLDGQAAYNKGRAMGKKETKAGWFGRNEEHMRNVLFAAYTQNPELKKLLLATGNAYLVEHGPDKFWHNGIDGTGQNKLGELLMELRGKLGGHGIVATAPASYHRVLAHVNRQE